MYFPAKRKIWFSIFIWGFILFMILIYIFGGDPVGQQFITYKSVPGYTIGALIFILLLWIWFGTGYQVNKELLVTRFGPFKSKIKIKEIRSIRGIKKSGSSSLSVDKFEVYFGKYGVIKISPKNEENFVQSLLVINPNIKLDGVSLEFD